jgi:hypothetical protein
MVDNTRFFGPVRLVGSVVAGLFLWLPVLAQMPDPNAGRLAVLERQYRANPADTARAVALATAWQRKAEWFRQTPQFNLDSSLRYSRRAIALLQKTSPLPEEALMRLYVHVGTFHIRLKRGKEARQYLGWAWAIAEKQQQRGIQRPALFYAIRAEQARCELYDRNGDTKKAMALMLEAVSLASDDSPRLKACVLKDKGLFYSRYNIGITLRADMGIPLLHQSLRLYESFPPPTDYWAMSEIYRELVWWA